MIRFPVPPFLTVRWDGRHTRRQKERKFAHGRDGEKAAGPLNNFFVSKARAMYSKKMKIQQSEEAWGPVLPVVVYFFDKTNFQSHP